ncbi:hypothetical protein WR25_24852 [Diploscapter pachys]|uniref:Iron-binding zinc finger CDGSH type domain-containing protein n=1 Tax=Diploscapter pachys TaxID=2018661 RepID=A0A2A2L4J2_9BILA|nr:hypothetical protein WR25_24852 [Diploscapter pachys]
MHCSTNSGGCQVKCIAYGVGLVAGGALIGYLIGTKLTGRKGCCNQSVQLGCDKVVDQVDVEDIGEKKAFCRCWKSSKFPHCDGSHNKHNAETGDNVGPLIVKNEKKT